MVQVEDLKRRKKDLHFSCREISDRSGVPLGTVQKIFSGVTKSPRRDTLLRLAKALESAEAPDIKKKMSHDLPGRIAADESKRKEDSFAYSPGRPDADMAAELSYAYGSSALSDNSNPGRKRQGEYTVEDYLALPEDERYELIDGVLYRTFSPTSNHQEIAGFLYYQLMNCVMEHNAPCRPYIAPLDVQLDKDNRTMLQPDVIVNCDPAKNIGPRLFGAPDFVAEVLSPSTSNRDLIIKLNKYFLAGVREYWILDSKKRLVTVHEFGEEADPRTYSFEDDIPLGISEGKCTISMKGILPWLI